MKTFIICQFYTFPASADLLFTSLFYFCAACPKQVARLLLFVEQFKGHWGLAKASILQVFGAELIFRQKDVTHEIFREVF